MNAEQLAVIAARLDRVMWTPSGVLMREVTENGLCFWAFDRDEVPQMCGTAPADATAAALLCVGCPVQDECLELDLRECGPHTVGVWGAMAEDDRRALHPLWLAREDPIYRAGGAS